MLKDIKGYEGKYAVNEEGQVYSYYKKDFMKPSIGTTGYAHVNLSKNGKPKTFDVHKLVLMTFDPVEDMSNLQVGHINENRLDNRLVNLTWQTIKENNNMPLRKERLKTRVGNGCGKPVQCIETGIIYYSATEAARQTNCNSCGIGRCCSGKQKTCGGYHWQWGELK